MQNKKERQKEQILRMSGVNPRKCMRCGKCSGTCPSYDEMEYHPHQFVYMVENGDIEALMKSNSIYKCLSCFACVDRCPRGVEPAKLVEMPASWYLDDFPHSEFVQYRTGMKPQSQIFEIWKAHFDYGVKHIENGLMVVCMHPQVIGRPHNITMLETFINHVLENEGYFAPLGVLYESVVF